MGNVKKTGKMQIAELINVTCALSGIH